MGFEGSGGCVGAAIPFGHAQSPILNAAMPAPDSSTPSGGPGQPPRRLRLKCLPGTPGYRHLVAYLMSVSE